MPVIINGSTGISGTDGSAGTPAVQGTDGNTGMFFPAADQIAFAEGGVEAMRLTAAGDVGIGVTSPVDKLALYNSGAVYQRWQNATTGTGASDGYQLGVDSAGQAFVWQYENQPLVFATNNTERARITSGGDFLVGLTTKTTPSGMSGTNLQVSTGFSVANSSLYAAYTLDRINFNNSNYYVLNQASTGVVLPNGNTSWSAQSDERLKDIIEPIEGAAAKVASLRSVIGRYKKDEPTKRRAFLIAQDVRAVLPEAVTEDDQGYLLLAYTELVPLLTAALQEALTEIAALKARVAALEATP